MMDFFVYVIVFVGKDEFVGFFIENIFCEGWCCVMEIFVFFFVDVGKWVLYLMLNGGFMVILIYFGVECVVLFYNVMGVVKVVLEVFMCYMVCDFGLSGICVNVLLVGLMCILVMVGIFGGKLLMKIGCEWFMMKEDIKMEGVVGVVFYLLFDFGYFCIGEILYVDVGFYVVVVLSIDED